MTKHTGNTTSANVHKAQKCGERATAALQAESRDFIGTESGEYIRLSAVRVFFVGPGDTERFRIKADIGQANDPYDIAQFETRAEAQAALATFMEPISVRMGE